MPNPTVQPQWSAYTVLTKTLASLPSSSTLSAGREMPVIDNSSTLYDDVEISGKVTCGTTPTAQTQILVQVFTTIDDTPTYPDVFGGADAAKTLTTFGVGQGFLRTAAVMQIDGTTSDRAYYFTATGIAALFNGYMPKRVGIFILHNSAVNLNATESNHIIKWRGLNWIIPTV